LAAWPIVLRNDHVLLPFDHTVTMVVSLGV